MQIHAHQFQTDPASVALSLADIVAKLQRQLPAEHPARQHLENSIAELHAAQHVIDAAPSAESVLDVPPELSGTCAGAQYGANAKEYYGLANLGRLLKFGMDVLPENVMDRAARELLDNKQATDQEVAEFWQSIHATLPNKPEDAQAWLSSFFMTAHTAFKTEQERRREHQRQLQEARRKYDG